MTSVPPKSAEIESVLQDDVLQAAVTAHMAGAQFIQACRLSGGVSADVYRLEIVAGDGASRSAVLRVHGPRHNGHPARLEFDVLRAVAGLGLCAPRVLALDESRAHIPYPFLILEHVEGETVFPASPADSRIVRMAEALARIHAVPITGLPALPRRTDPIPEILEYLPRERDFDALRHGLSNTETARHDGPAALLHGDFWPGNLLWKGEHLAGILDWEDSALGDPLSDVACTALELRYVAGPEGAESFVRAYDALRPIQLRRLALWQIYVAAAGHHSMGAWGLEPEREAHMRATALSVIRQASASAI